MTVRNACKADTITKEKIKVPVREEREESEGISAARIRVSNALFERAEMTPGALEKYNLIVEEDLERYSAALKIFKERPRRLFDERNRLLPLPPAAKRPLN